MKVKIINEDNAYVLEKSVNKFIEEIEKEHMEVKDIRYSNSNNSFNYSVLILYGPDGKLYLNLGNSLSESEYNDEFGVTA